MQIFIRFIILTSMANKFRILIVDDTKYIRDHMKGILEENYIVETAGSKEDAIKKFKIAQKQTFGYDVILLDNYLPERDAGIEVLEFIKENKIDTIALMISSHTESESEPFKTGMKAFQAGAVDFLPKPFRQDDLRDKIGRLITKKKQAQAIVHMAQASSPENYKEQLEDILADAEVDMITKERITGLFSQPGDLTDDSAFLSEPRNIEVSGSSSKSHNNMWNKRINCITDIPAEARNTIFKVIASHRQVYKIKFTKFGHSGVFNEYKFKIRPVTYNSGQLLCSLYGPSPITCTHQEFIISVDAGFEQKIKSDLETRLAEYCR